MAVGHGYPAGGSGRGELRASDADRDRVADILGTAFSEGRLSKDEYDARLEGAFSARTYADLDQLLSDLPAAPSAMMPLMPGRTPVASNGTPVARTNGLAVASLACGIAQFTLGPMGTIPAIVLGHVARSQIRRTGEQGAGLALAGLVLGWGALILGFVLIAAMVVVAGTRGAMHVH